MLELFIFILVAYGATNIMIYGSIFNNFRSIVGVNSEEPKFFGKLFGCFMCLPFWWGVILSLFMFSPTLSSGLMSDINIFNWFIISKDILSVFFDGCLGSGSVWILHTLQESLE